MTWLKMPAETGFGLANLPYGSFSPPGGRRRLGVAIGDHILDLGAIARELRPDFADAVAGEVLNPLLAQGPAIWAEVRTALTEWLSDPAYAPVVTPHLFDRESATLYLPFDVGDYVDFYASEAHARNVGRIFRPGAEPLPPNWRHLPIGYHGRSGSIVVSGTHIRRPQGQSLPVGDSSPVFGPSARLDIEAELGFVIGGGSPIGTPIQVSEFPVRVFGAFILNDWSARDIQAWEYVPLGPFLGKSFATSISPWVVPLGALDAARVPPPPRDPQPLDYLRDVGDWGLDVQLTVSLNDQIVSRPPFRSMYWTAAQQLAHMTVNGAPTRAGDVYASGTVSGLMRDQWGSLLEITHNGREPLLLSDGSSRQFLEDGDRVRISAMASGSDGALVDFGSVEATILPAL